MRDAKSVQLSLKHIRSLGAVLIWVAVITGVFGILTGSLIAGVAWTLGALILLVIVLEGSLPAKLASKRLPLASILLVTVVIILIGLSELLNLLVTSPAFTVSYIFDALYSIGFLILGGYSAYLMLTQNR